VEHASSVEANRVEGLGLAAFDNPAHDKSARRIRAQGAALEEGLAGAVLVGQPQVPIALPPGEREREGEDGGK
jgi:hypothetical protein